MQFGKLITAAGLILILTACSPSQQDSLLQTVVEMGRDAANLEVKTSKLDDVTMTYLERQGEGPVMLLLHGFSANKDTWIQFAAELPDHYRLIVPDLAGHGDTPAPKGEDYNLIRQAERLNQLMANININKFHIAGNSMGGAISAIYASLYPQQISSLTLIDAAGVDAPNQSEYMAALEAGNNPLIATDEASFEYRMDFVMSKAPLLPWPLRPALMRKTLARQQLNKEIFEDLLATRKQLENSDFEARLSKTITMPTLIIWGEEDRVLDVSAAEVFKQKIPHAQVKIYEGIGHLPMVEIPEETATLYSEFVAGAE
jgi:pimeloyl-ACP methyl ester carboxylesterase